MSQRRRVAGCIALGASLAFAAEQPVATGSVLDVPGTPLGVVAADVDGDTRADLVVWTSGALSRLVLLRNQGDGHFAAAMPVPDLSDASTTALSRLIAIDVDRDGDLDLLGAGRPAALWRNDGTGAFVAEALPPEADGDRIAASNDGPAPDLLVTRDDGAAAPLVLVNDGMGRFEPSGSDATPFARFARTATPQDLFAVADFDGDARLDVATPTTTPRAGVALLLSRGAISSADEQLVLLRGRILDRDTAQGDRVLVAGVIPEPAVSAIEAGGSAKIRVTCGDATFDSDAPGARVQLDVARRRFTVSATNFDFASAADNPVVVALETTSGRWQHSAAWRVARAGDLRWTGLAIRGPERPRPQTVSPFEVTTSRSGGDDVATLREKSSGRTWRYDAASGRWMPVAPDLAKPSVSLDAGLAAFLPLDRDLADTIGKDDVVNRGGVEVRDGEAHFDGSGWLELPHVALNGPHAFSMWIRTEGEASVMGLVEQRDANAGNRHYHLMLRGNLQPYLGFYMNDLAAPAPIDRQAWRHLVFQYTGREQEIWVDGVRVAKRSASAYAGTTGATRIGRNPGWAGIGGTNFVGSMRRVRFYGRSLGENEIAELRRREAPAEAQTTAKATLVFDGPIDGSERVVITSAEARWENVFWGTSQGVFTLNGVAWEPRKAKTLANSGGTRFLPPGVDLSKARIVSREVRDYAAIEVEPGRLVLRFVDSPNGSARYHVVIAFD